MRGRAGCIMIYAGVLLILACWNAWRVQNLPFDCDDGYGHGPDPGTRECNHAIEMAQANRPHRVASAFAAPLVGGGGLLAIYFILLPFAQLPFFKGRTDRDR